MAYGLSIVSDVVVEDSKGKQSTIHFNHPLNVDLGALKDAIRSTVQLIDAIIQGKIISASIGLEVNLPAGLSLKATAIAGADVEEGVRFTFSTNNGAETGFRIPSFAETFLNDSGILDFANATVDAFIQRVIGGQTVGLVNVSPSDAFGDDVTTYTAGVESFSASRG